MSCTMNAKYRSKPKHNLGEFLILKNVISASMIGQVLEIIQNLK